MNNFVYNCGKHGKLTSDQVSTFYSNYKKRIQRDCLLCKREIHHKNKDKDPAIYISKLSKGALIYCNMCLQDKPISDYNRAKGMKLKFPLCNSCYPKRETGNKRLSVLRVTYGMNNNDYDRLAIQQNNKCAICNLDSLCLTSNGNAFRKLTVDHDHNLEKIGIIHIRGLLCQKCNQAIGFLNDDPELLKRAIHYLQKEPVLIKKMRLKFNGKNNERLYSGQKQKEKRQERIKKIQEKED